MEVQFLLVYIGVFFAIAITGSILLYVLSIFYWKGNTTNIFTANTSAANWTTTVSRSIYNISTQLPNAGTLIGVAVLIGVIGLMGIGGFYAYRQAKGYM